MAESDVAVLIAAGRAAKAQKRKRTYSANITRDEGLYLQYQLRRAGRSCADIARTVGCDRSAVQLVVTGQRHSRRIEKTVCEVLGYTSWNSMVQQLRSRAA